MYHIELAASPFHPYATWASFFDPRRVFARVMFYYDCLDAPDVAFEDLVFPSDVSTVIFLVVSRLLLIHEFLC